MDNVIRDGGYAEGFEAGFRSIRGLTAPLPGISVQHPPTRANMTAYLMGVRKGIEHATGKNIDGII